MAQLVWVTQPATELVSTSVRWRLDKKRAERLASAETRQQVRIAMSNGTQHGKCAKRSYISTSVCLQAASSQASSSSRPMPELPRFERKGAQEALWLCIACTYLAPSSITPCFANSCDFI